jgi:competence protein ComEC
VTDRSIAAAPLLPPAAAFAGGIAAASWLTVPSPPLLALAAGLLLAALICARRAPRVAVAFVLAAVAALGVLRAAPPPLPEDHLARRAREGVLTIEGRLAQEPVRWAPDRVRLLLDAEAIHLGSERLPASGLVQLTVYGEPAAPLGEGQRVIVDARVHRPIGYRNPGSFDYPAHLRREGILLVGNARAERVVALTADAPPWRVALKRWAVQTIASRLPEASAALLAGLLLGERSALPPVSDEAFRRAGVYHILAVSGFNVALLV